MLYKFETQNIYPNQHKYYLKSIIHIPLVTEKKLLHYQSRTKIFKFSFLPWAIAEWNKLHLQICQSSHHVFRNYLLKRIQPLAAPIYDIHNPLGMKLLAELKLGISRPNEIIVILFSHNFENCINHLCNCSWKVKSTTSFSVHCYYFNALQITLLSNLEAMDKDILNISDNSLANLLIFGESKFNNIQNYAILGSGIT